MPRKAAPARAIGPDWYLVEWMRYYDKSQADIIRATGWGKARVNDIVHGRTDYYRDILNELARFLNIHPYELLMPPDDAMAVRRMREGSLQMVADPHKTFTPPEEAGERLDPKRKTG